MPESYSLWRGQSAPAKQKQTGGSSHEKERNSYLSKGIAMLIGRARSVRQYRRNACHEKLYAAEQEDTAREKAEVGEISTQDRHDTADK
jgi:hypothetical protein